MAKEKKKPIKVLIVEDEFMLYDKLEQSLTQHGYEVFDYCDTYAEAMRVLENKLPDVAIIDIGLPGPLSGINLAKRITEDFEVPFFFLTAYSTPEVIKEASLADPGLYMLKTNESYNIEQIIVSIDYVIQLKSNKLRSSVPTPVQQRRGVLAQKEWLTRGNSKERSHNEFLKDKDIIMVCTATDIEPNHIIFVNELDIANEDGSIDKKQLRRFSHARKTLKSFIEEAPDFYLQISQDVVINTNYLSGTSFGHRVTLTKGDKEVKLIIGKTFKEEVWQYIRYHFSP